MLGNFAAPSSAGATLEARWTRQWIRSASHPSNPLGPAPGQLAGCSNSAADFRPWQGRGRLANCTTPSWLLMLWRFLTLEPVTAFSVRLITEMNPGFRSLGAACRSVRVKPSPNQQRRRERSEGRKLQGIDECNERDQQKPIGCSPVDEGGHQSGDEQVDRNRYHGHWNRQLEAGLRA